MALHKFSQVATRYGFLVKFVQTDQMALCINFPKLATRWHTDQVCPNWPPDGILVKFAQTGHHMAPPTKFAQSGLTCHRILSHWLTLSPVTYWPDFFAECKNSAEVIYSIDYRHSATRGCERGKGENELSERVDGESLLDFLAIELRAHACAGVHRIGRNSSSL